MTYKSVWDKKTEFMVFTIIMIGLAPIFYEPVSSYDIWLHLKTGEHIVQHDFALPQIDPFCYTTQGKSLILNEWLSQVLLYAVHQTTNFSGLRIMRVILELAALSMVFWAAFRLSGRFSVALLILLVSAYLYRTRYFIRPELFSLIFFSFLYTWSMTKRTRAKVVHYVFFFVLCALWVNLHPFMLFAGGMIAIAITAEMAQKILRLDKWFRASDKPFDLKILFLLFLVASLVSPHGFHIYQYVSKATPIVKQLIPEWQPIFISLQRETFRSITGGVLAFPFIMKGIVIGTILLFSTVLALAYKRKIIWTLEDVLMGSLTCYLAIIASRFAWLLIVPLLLSVKYGRLLEKDDGLSRGIRRLTPPLILGCIALFCLYWIGQGHERILYNLKNEIETDKYPVVSTMILNETKLVGTIYNPPAWGGYLTYHLFPDYKTAIDTRTYLHGEAAVVDYMMLQYQYPGFQKLIDAYQFDILLFKKMYGDKLPFLSTEWILIYEDPGSAMYLKKNDRNTENLNRIKNYYIKHNVLFDLDKGFDRRELKKQADVSSL